MIYEVPCEIVAQAESFWNDEGIPFLREAKTGEQILILGWSVGQELPVLLSRELTVDEDYGDAAAEAIRLLPDNLPSTFTCNGIAVAEISDGFYDGSGDHWTEATFSEYWQATLLQCWLDSCNVPLCIRPSSDMQDGKIINDHTFLAHYYFDRTIKHAAFKDMGIRYDIRKYVAEYWDKNQDLPEGSHTLLSGLIVVFPSLINTSTKAGN